MTTTTTATQPITVEVSEDGTEAWTHFSHLSCDDFGRTGTVKPWKIAKVFEMGIHMGMGHGQGMEKDAGEERRRSSVIFGQRYTFSAALWHVHLSKMVFPHKVSAEVCDMGRSSMTIRSHLVNELDNHLLATCLTKLICFDIDARSPVPFSETHRNKFMPSPQKRHLLRFSMAPPEIPPSAYRYKTTVAPSDMDINGHTNHSSYIRICCDATQSALMEGRLHGYHSDISRYPLKELEIIFMGESSMGIQLEVLLWQQAGQPEKVMFWIKKIDKDEETSVPVLSASMIYDLQHPVKLHKL